MNKNEIEVGGKYEAKAGKRWVGVTILGPAKTGWNAVSDMGKPVKVKDARNLRPAAGEPVVGTNEPAGDTIDAPVTPVAPPKRARGATTRVAEPDAIEEVAGTGEPATEATPAPKRASRTQARPATKTATTAPLARMSCLNAAATVLKVHGGPMQCKAMIDAMHRQGLWSSDAPTPAATLYSAILREMKVKGDRSRFQKTGRGHFGLTGRKE
jgi:hypothetical protein